MFYRVVEQIKRVHGGRAGEYVIVITGDLSDNAHEEDNFRKAKAGVNALKEAGFNDVLLVPGNHDYGTGDRGDKKFVKLFREIFYGDDLEFPRKDIIEDFIEELEKSTGMKVFVKSKKIK